MPASEVFTVEQRTHVLDRVLALARADARIIAGAVVGSLAAEHTAETQADRWSDLDLTFAVTSAKDVLDVLDRFTRTLANEFAAVPLFDLPYDGVLYRVLLLRGALQVDLSAAPPAKFGARGPNFRLLFGQQTPQVSAVPSAPSFGYAVHHAVRARFCIERGRLWQAEFWISQVRDLTLSMACARLGLNGAYGRGFDQLPADLLTRADQALVRALDPFSLVQSLAGAISLLLGEASETATLEPLLQQRLHLLTHPWHESN